MLPHISPSLQAGCCLGSELPWKAAIAHHIYALIDVVQHGLTSRCLCLAPRLPWLDTGVLIPLGIIYYFLQRYFRRTCIELQRLDAISRSPVYANFSETMNGLDTITAYQLQSRCAVIMAAFPWGKSLDVGTDVTNVCTRRFHPEISPRHLLIGPPS